jgi:hypothetical protein
MARLPEKREILIDEIEEVGAEATLRTEYGYVVSIQAYAASYETGLFILHEYLDELGYDDKIRKVNNG